MWRLPVELIWGLLTVGAVITGFLVRLAFQSHRTSVKAGTSRMIGQRGKAVMDVAPEGRVFVGGEYWWAYSRGKIAEGESVRVIGLDGLTLEVEACPGKGVIPRPVSAIDNREVQDQ
ncbi:MAG: NfeD family protein [Blastocatellia bacterium]